MRASGFGATTQPRVLADLVSGPRRGYLCSEEYELVSGEFLSVDSTGGSDGEPYGYAGKSPLSGVDPSGWYSHR